MYKIRGHSVKKSDKRGRGPTRNVLETVILFVTRSVPTLINRAMDVLPVELHLPGYRFCGQGARVEERLARGERGINELDEACREHDIAYATYKNNERRRAADLVLAGKTWARVKALKSSEGFELAYALSLIHI